MNMFLGIDKTVTNLGLMTKDNVTRDSFQEHIKHLAFIVASSVSDTNRMGLHCDKTVTNLGLMTKDNVTRQ